MFNGRPIICCNSGGPLETVAHEECGYLLDQKPEIWAKHMNVLANDKEKVIKMGQAGKKRA